MNEIGEKGGLVAPGDVADLAGVTPAAVSNWRRRYGDFPKPAGGTAARPLFRRDEIEQWLVANGYELQRDSGELALWAVFNRYRDRLSMQITRPLVLALLCARKLADNTADLQMLTQAASSGSVLGAIAEISGRSGADPQWQDFAQAGLLPLVRYSSRDNADRTIEQLASDLFLVIKDISVEKLADVSDWVLARVGATEGRLAGEHGSVGSAISRMFAAGGARIAGTAYDPACGIGESLLELWRQSPASHRLKLVGADINEEYVLVCKQRCFLAGADAEIETADILVRDPHPYLRADVVVAEPPIGVAMPAGFSVTDPRWALAGPPPKNSSETAFLQHAVTHLACEGLAFVITGINATLAAKMTTIRRSLLERGCIQAVILLPPQMLPYSSIRTVLWVLRSAEAERSIQEVLFVDASRIESSAEMPIRLWLSNPEGYADRRLSWTRRSIDSVLADDGATLNPRRWTEPALDVEQISKRFTVSASQLQESIELVEQNVRLTFTHGLHSPRSVDVGTLEKQGALRVLPARTRGRSKSDIDDPRVSPWLVTSRAFTEGLPEFSESDRQLAIDLLTDSNWNTTEPGDVLVSTAGDVRAIVDRAGGHFLAPGIIQMRVDQNQFKPGYVAACLSASWNQRPEFGSPSRQVNPRELEIPLLPIDQQRELVETLDRAQCLASAGQRIALASQSLVDAQLDALRFDVRLS